jgi:hypothetical protein
MLMTLYRYTDYAETGQSLHTRRKASTGVQASSQRIYILSPGHRP